MIGWELLISAVPAGRYELLAFLVSENQVVVDGFPHDSVHYPIWLSPVALYGGQEHYSGSDCFLISAARGCLKNQEDCNSMQKVNRNDPARVARSPELPPI